MENQSNYIRRLLSNWQAEPTIASNITEWREIPPRHPATAPIPNNLHPALAHALHSQNIESLYAHQAQSWEYIQAGNNIIITTGTASGKSLCYNLPILDQLLRVPETCALYIFPTKALAQDQASIFKSFVNSLHPTHLQELDVKLEIPYAIYDGDTPSSARSRIRKNARLLITNPDMLHLGILPHHTAWAHFFQNLSFIVLDEAHIYRGVFGSHVANVIRRLKRIAAYYGASPQFILTSATIANPIDLAQKLIEEEIKLIDQDGSARGPRKFLIYNPPIIDKELGLRRSALQESVRLAEDLLTFDVQTIIFGRSRRSVELILTYLREHSSNLSQNSNLNSQAHLATENDIRGYRGGYLPGQRREVEHGLRSGDIRTVIATNALELGIDIGGLGAALLVGYPGSIAATWQQSGRAGRGDQTALSILVATSAPLDQFLASHPEYFFQRSPEHALINPYNLLILLEHIRCALFELPFEHTEGFGDLDAEQLREFLAVLQEEGVLHTSKDKYFWMSDSYPAQAISLRSLSTSPVNLQVWDDQGLVTIGQVDQASASWMVHPNAIYLHEGKQYLVEDLDFESNIAVLKPSHTDYYTVPRSKTIVQVIERQNQIETKHITKAYGEIQVTSQLTGYHKIRWYTHERLGTEDLSMPPTDLFTTGYWLSLSDYTVDSLRESGLWNSDPNNYGPNWNEQKDKARARDGYHCRVCGAAEGDHAHHVHHISPFRTFSTYQEANRLENNHPLSCLSQAG